MKIMVKPVQLKKRARNGEAKERIREERRSQILFSAMKIFTKKDFTVILTAGIGSGLGAVFGARLTDKINRKVLVVILAAMAILPGIYLSVKK